MKSFLLFALLMIGDQSHGHTQVKGLTDEWEVIQGDNEGKLLLIRRNAGCAKLTKKEKKYYTVRFGIAVNYISADEGGLPAIKEMDKLRIIEDSVFTIMQQDYHYIVSLILTTNGVREYVLYGQDKLAFRERLIRLLKGFPATVITNYAEDDKDWEIYSQF